MSRPGGVGVSNGAAAWAHGMVGQEAELCEGYIRWVLRVLCLFVCLLCGNKGSEQSLCVVLAILSRSVA